MENFQCKACNCSFLITQFRISFQQKTPTYLTKENLSVTCPYCGSIQVQPLNKGICINIGEYSSASWEDKQMMLRKRADQAKRKYEEQHRVIEQEFDGRANPAHY
jgi:RNase P subunit RPR2